MALGFFLLSKKDQSHQQWSGGQTTQFFIYPIHASYENRNFIFRISSASVTEFKTVFTNLMGFHRSLMILSGSLKIIHHNCTPKLVMPYDCIEFDGGIQTTSEGIATDFNVMTSKLATQKVRFVQLNTQHAYSLDLLGENHFKGIYLIRGQALVSTRNEYRLNEGDFVMLNESEQSTATLIPESNISIVEVDIILEAEQK